MSKKPTYEEWEQVAKAHGKRIVELEKLFNITPAMICIAGTDGYFKYLNQEWGVQLKLSFGI